MFLIHLIKEPFPHHVAEAVAGL